MDMDSFTALSEPNRRRIVELLATNGQLSASEIGAQFAISPPAISQHLKVLREAGLIKVEKRAQQRIYSMEPAGFSEMEQWIQHMRAFWDSRFEALDRLLKADKQNTEKE